MEGPAGLTLTALNTSILIILLTAILLVVRRLFSKQSSVATHENLLHGLASPTHVMLSEKTVVNHDTVILRFAMPNRNMRLGINIGQHVRI